MKETPSYYAIIPASVRYADISANAKLLFGEITALCNKEGFCWASNLYFAKLYKVNPTTISEWVRQLKELGVLDYTITDGKKRQIVLRENPKHASGKAEAGASGKAEHNNTEENNTVNKITANAEVKFVFDLFKEIKPSYEILFKRKHEWAAAKRLHERYGIPYLEKVARLVKSSNGMPYAPVITSPAELEEKMAKLEAFWQQRKGKVEEKNKSKFSFTK